MKTYNTKKTRKLLRRVTAGILSFVIFAGSFAADYAGFNEEDLSSEIGAEYAADGAETDEVETVPPVDDEEDVCDGADSDNGEAMPPDGEEDKPSEDSDADDGEIMSSDGEEESSADGTDIENGIVAAPPESEAEYDDGVLFSAPIILSDVDGLDCDISLKENGLWKVTFSGSANIPANIIDSEEFAEYRNNIDEVVISQGITGIDAFAFYGLTALRTVTFQENNSVREIGAGAFKNCTALSSVQLENCKGLETIGSSSNDADIDGAFESTALREITIPESLKVIGTKTFNACYSLLNVHFEDNCQVNFFGAEAFARCEAMETIDLENCTADKITFNRRDQWSGPFFRCQSLESVIIPGGASGDLSCLFVESLKLKSITFEENTNNISNISQIILKTAVDVLDLTPLKGMGEIGAWQIRGDMTKVMIPSTVKSLGMQVMSDMKSLDTVEFEQNDQIWDIPVQAFQNDSSLVTVNLDALSNLSRINTSAFYNCSSLFSIDLPPKMNELGAQVFAGCSGLTEFRYNAANLQYIGDNIFDGAGEFDFIVGPDVRSIPVGFLLQAQDNISSLHFESPVTFTVGSAGESTGLKAPFTVGGTYCSDSNGNLYLIENNEAKLIYADKDAKALTIPAFVGGYTVTGISSGAFKDCNVISLEFEDPKNIRSIENNAFANAAFLEEINGKTEIEDIKALFADDAVIGSNIFANTKISGGSSTGIFSTNASAQAHTEDIIIKGDDGVKQLNFLVLNQKDEISNDPDRNGMFWTGQTAMVSVGGKGGHPVRMYIQASDIEKIELAVDPQNSEFKPTETDGIYYIDLAYITDSNTTTYTINISYPNFTKPGNKIQIWGIEFDSEAAFNAFKADHENKMIEPASEDGEGYKVTDKYFEIEWTTKPETFELVKTSASDYSPKFVFASDGKVVLSNLTYDITFSAVPETGSDDRRENGSETKLGSDIVHLVDYTDIIDLPPSISWRDEIFDHLSTAKYTQKDDSGTLYVTINGKEYELFTLTGFSHISSMSAEKAADGKLALCWTIRNPNQRAEISPVDNGKIAFGPEVLVADENIRAGSEIGQIRNDLYANETFSYSEMQSNDASDVIAMLVAPDSQLTINKETLKKVKYMGEDIIYKITVENPSAFVYSDLKYIEDAFNGNSNQYIKPENIQSLFDDPENGQYLTVTIHNAILAEALDADQKTEVTLISGGDGDKAFLSEQDTANKAKLNYDGLADDNSIALEQATIILKKSGDDIVLSYSSKDNSVNNTYNFHDVASALDSIHYIVTMSDNYALRWNYPDDYQLSGGEVMEFIINATVKDSLMSLPYDNHYYYDYPGGADVKFNNKAELYTKSDPAHPLTASTAIESAHFDLKISKGAMVDSEVFDERYNLQDNDILDYTINIEHYGSGIYDILPVVDHMSGLQAVIVSAEMNKDAPWTAYAATYEKDGTEYYVLNAKKDPGGYTYKGVWTNGFYADSITVTPSTGGLDTIIKYYLKNAGNGNYNPSVTYKAISSQELAGNDYTTSKYSIANQAWLNDRPGHRIYDTILGGGSAVEFDKDIVIEKSSTDPAKDILDDDDALPISHKNNVVTYRLSLENIGRKQIVNGQTKVAPAITLEGKDIFDMLPLTGGAFNWRDTRGSGKPNISMSYSVGSSGYDSSGAAEYGRFTYNGEVLEGASSGNEWRISGESPSPKVKPQEADKADQKYIIWEDGFEVYLPAEASVYIYVTLTFTDTNEEWEEFLDKKGKTHLINTLYVHELPSSVTHSLTDTAMVLLQKGVYETGANVLENGSGKVTNEYVTGPDKWHYTNNLTDENGNFISNTRTRYSVTYYVVLRNSGRTNLYVAPIYDILPEGFTYMAMRCGDGRSHTSNWYHVGNDNVDNAGRAIPTQSGGSSTVLAMPEEYSSKEFDDHFVRTGVRYVYDTPQYTADGRQILKFELENGIENSNELLQDENGYYYLEPGQFIQFGYTVYTGGREDVTTAINTVAMQYFDPYSTGSEAELDTQTKVVVSDYNKISPNNDGSREQLSSGEAANMGFTEVIEEGNANPDWFASTVTVTREKIAPGINKTVGSTMAEAGKPVDWTVTSYNNGSSTISGYTIKDTVDAPFKFEGDFTYFMYGMDGKPYAQANHYLFKNGAASILFHIQRDGDNVKIFGNADKPDSGGHDLVINGDKVTLNVGTSRGDTPAANTGGDAKITVQLLRDDDKNTGKIGNETLIIEFPDHRWDIIPGGYSELKYSTSCTDGIEPAPYDNKAQFLPDDQEYNPNYKITQGSLVTDANGNNAGVQSAATVNVYVGSPSESIKMIEEVGNTDNNATSESKPNYIVLSDKEKLFTYTLEVHNGSAVANMSDLVLIDSLPEKDDCSPLKEESMRESEFKVDLADDLQFTVLLNEDLANDPWFENCVTLTKGVDYFVEFSDDSKGFDDDDWNGLTVAGSKWYDMARENTRSIRVRFEREIPKKAAIRVRFNAVIDENADAKPGQIAWNSFGYNYRVGATSKAAPAKVGVRIPGAPEIRKNVVDADGNPSPVSKDTAFSFIIYDGDEISFDDHTSKTVGETLSENRTKFTYFSVIVPEGKSSSDITYLKEFREYGYNKAAGTFSEIAGQDPMSWVIGKTYHIVELEDSADHIYRSTNGYTDQNNFKFVYDIDGNIQLSFVNAIKRILWGVELTKTDEDDEPLAGALFGIYTSDVSKRMNDSKFNALQIESSYKTIEENDIVYYLMDAQESGEGDGIILWNNLTEETYFITELKAPEGYNIDSTHYEISISEAAENNYLCQLTVQNIRIIEEPPSVVLPSAGGNGTRAAGILGALLLCIAALLSGYQFKRRRV